MEIRKTTPADLPALDTLYAAARLFMAEQGNPRQWGTEYPRREWLELDIREGVGYVCEENGEIIAAFMFAIGEEPTYTYIEGEGWPDDQPYGVVHRLAAGGRRQGAAEFCLRWCLERCGNLRIDTHEDNKPMRNLLDKLGFTYCGTIYVEDGTPRRAYWLKE